MINYKIKKLKNGLTFVSAPITSTEAVTIFILVGIGARFESKDNNGISHYLEHLFFKGTKNRPTPEEVARDLDSIGASYNAFTGEEYTGFYLKADANDFEKGFDILSDMFLNPTFPENELEREKDVILEEIKMHRDIPQHQVQRLSQEQMFGKTPLGRPMAGTEQSVKSISRQDVMDFRLKGYDPEKTYVVICGNPKKSDWNKAVEGRFAALESRKPSQYDDFAGFKIENKVVQEVRKVDQAHLVFSVAALPKTDDRWSTLSIISNILGSGMSSRLFSEIREKRGWAYYVETGIWALHDTGIIEVVAGVQKDKVAQSIKIISEQIEDIKKNGVAVEELERAKGNLRGQLAISLEDSSEIAEFLADDLVYFGKVRDISNIISDWNKVTNQDIITLANEIFQSDKMGVAIIGPKDYKKELNFL
jgi:predicted Zn-dependent peptidase